MLEPESAEDAAPRSPFELASLSQLGAITGRFVHDLANEISSASTVLSLVHDPNIDEPPAKEDMDELAAALDRAVTLIHRFGATVRSLRPAPGPIPCSQLLARIQEVTAHYPSLTLSVAAAKFETLSAICRDDWFVHCLDYAARAYSASNAQVTVSLVSAKEVKPPVEYYAFDKSESFFRISFSCPAKNLPANLEKTASEENQELFVTRELLRHMRGFLLVHLTANHSAFEIHLGCKPL